MSLIETQILHGPIAFLDHTNSIELELAKLGVMVRLNYTSIIIRYKLAILGLRKSE